MKEYIVVVKPGEDLTTLDSEMSANTGSGAVPNRAVECCDACPQDTRMTHWKLTDEEAKTLEGDARILAVELPYEDMPHIIRKPSAWQSGTFNKTDTNDGVNWGLSRCSSQINNFEGNTSIFDNYKYAMTGEGVDFVVFDTGIEVNHPEFQDASGGLRVMQLDWFANHSGVTNPYAAQGPLGAGFYTDEDGHGTHVAGIAAGKTYGWAKNAHIYSIKMLSSGGPDSISDTLGMDLIRFWHENKGNNRPTIVNMSYGYTHVIDGWTGAAANDVGQHWDTFTNQMDHWTFGDANFASAQEVNIETDIEYGAAWRPSYRSAAVDAKLDQLVAAGVHVTIAGNNNYEVQYNYSDDANDNYNDFFSRPSYNGGQAIYYHRGSSPRASTVKNAEIIVTNIGVTEYNNKEVLSPSSACGEAMDINAPGTNITSSCSTDTSDATGGPRNVSDYPPDPNFKIISISGTSMAAPQVCGVGALYLQADPTLTPAELKAKILHDAKTGLLHDTAWDQKDLEKYKYIESSPIAGRQPWRGLFGAPNIVLYNRYVGDVFVRYVAAGGGG